MVAIGFNNNYYYQIDTLVGAVEVLYISVSTVCVVQLASDTID